MTKKEVLAKILKKLSKDKIIGEDLITYIESDYIDEKTIDGIIKTISHAIKKTEGEHEKNKLSKNIQILKKIKEIENHTNDINAQNIEEILDNIE